MKIDPDISILLQAKKANRRRLAKLSFEEKIKIVRRLQKLHRSVKKEAERLPQTMEK